MGKVLAEGVITGGPAAGKTTAEAKIRAWGEDRGLRVIYMPEAATLAIMAGVPDIGHIAAEKPDLYYHIERGIFRLQAAMKDYARRVASHFEEDCIILYDRAEMDVASYMSEHDFETLLAEENVTTHDVRDSYDFVIYLRSCASGAEQFYTQENNPARYETAEEAALSDERTLNAWVGHPHLFIVENEDRFEDKIGKVLEILKRMIGEPLEIERKFVVENINMHHPVLKSARQVQIEQVYLETEDEATEQRVRKRTVDGHSTYYWTQKVRLKSGVKQETERQITPREYYAAINTAKTLDRTIKKTRYVFPYRSTYWELDVFQNPEGVAVLEAELYDINQEIHFPDCFDVVKEVTDDTTYHNASLARS